MNGQNEENLKELFERFLGVKEAERAVQDVEKAEQILRSHAAPEPDDMLVANIKAEIAMRTPARKVDVLRRLVYKTAAVAAAVIILAVISAKLFEKDKGVAAKVVYASIIPRAIWESDDITTDDVDLAILTAEIEQIESEVLTLQRGGNDSNGDKAVAELEMELAEINSAFWKG